MNSSKDQTEPAEPDDTPYAQTLGRGIEMLFLLSSGPLSSRGIGEALGLNRSTSYRLVQTLTAHGLVERDHADPSLYRLTPRLWELGVRAIGPAEIRAAAGKAVRTLSDKYGETVHLAIYHHGEVVYIDKADAWQPIGSYTRLGGRAPAYCVATGKALLAHQPAEEIRRCLDAALERFTPHTMTEPAEIAEVLAGIRHEGHADNHGEWRQDVGGIAVPLFDATGDPVAALGFSGPAARIEERHTELLRALHETANQISRGQA